MNIKQTIEAINSIESEDLKYSNYITFLLISNTIASLSLVYYTIVQNPSILNIIGFDYQFLNYMSIVSIPTIITSILLILYFFVTSEAKRDRSTRLKILQQQLTQLHAQAVSEFGATHPDLMKAK